MLIIQNKISLELNNWLKDKNYHSIFILVDENTKKHCLPLLELKNEYSLIEIESGEQNKNLQTCQQIWESLLSQYAYRNSLLINLGGGVITDMGSFCASTYKRGIDFVNIPTSLLAMVDASVGGKTGVDFQGQKNMIGLFSEAKEVLIDADFLKTLDQRELLSGFAEVLKHGLIQDKKYFEACIIAYNNETINWQDIIKKSINIKSNVVAKDPTEKGLRKILNFGHTAGHAFESYSLLNHQKPLFHGEAVILGILFSLKLSMISNLLPETIGNAICQQFLAIYSFDFLGSFDEIQIKELILNDKKNNSTAMQFIVLKDIGNAVYDFEITKKDFNTAYYFVLKSIENS